MTVRIEIDVPAIENSQAIVAFYRRFAAEALREAQILAAQRIEGGTGTYERSFDFDLRPGSPPKLVFGNTSSVALFIEEGTDPHVIRPTPAGRKSFTNPNAPGALRWFDPPGGGEGAARFGTEVHHPGTKAQNIIRDAVTNAGDKLRAS